VHKHRIRSISSAAAGFTLIELMVALALTVLTSLSLVEASRFCQRAYERVAHRGAQFQQVYAAQRFIRSAIETAYPGNQSSFGQGLRGSASALEFTARGPLAIAAGSMTRMRFDLVQGSDGRRDLEIRIAPDYASASDARSVSSGTAQAVVTGIESLDWSYRSLHRAEDDLRDDAGWSASWDSPELPQAIRLRVTFPEGDPRHWPELIAVTRVTDRADCIFDAVAQRCRR